MKLLFSVCEFLASYSCKRNLFFIFEALDLFVMSSSVWDCFHPFPLFQQSKKKLLNLIMKCWNSAFNAQRSRLIIVGVQVGGVKIYVAAVEALWKGKRG
jgi:hypothetical protein